MWDTNDKFNFAFSLGIAAKLKKVIKQETVQKLRDWDKSRGAKALGGAVTSIPTPRTFAQQETAKCYIYRSHPSSRSSMTDSKTAKYLQVSGGVTTGVSMKP